MSTELFRKLIGSTPGYERKPPEAPRVPEPSTRSIVEADPAEALYPEIRDGRVVAWRPL